MEYRKTQSIDSFRSFERIAARKDRGEVEFLKLASKTIDSEMPSRSHERDGRSIEGCEM